MKHYDLIIVGAGPVGLATAYHSAKEGLKVLVVEQYQLHNQLSSSSGATRQFRLQYSEEYMSKLCLESLSYWDELQIETKVNLLSKVGSLWFGVSESSSTEGEIIEAMRTMDNLSISYDKLDSKAIENNFHFKNLPEDYMGLFQRNGGTINVYETIQVLKKLCDKKGNVDFVFDSEVQNINTQGIIEVTTSKNKYISGKLLLSTGPFANRLLNVKSQLKFEIWQMVSLYFKISEFNKDLPSWFAFEKETEHDPGFYYGFEHSTWDNEGYVRIAPAYASDIFNDPKERRINPNEEDIQRTINWVKKRLSFVDSKPEFITSCLASIPDGNQKMYLDFLKEGDNINKNVVIFSSGWAFKFVPLLGKICTDLIKRGQTKFDISHFRVWEEKQSKKLELVSKRRLPF
jgi:glycine/D-amino acid oxidase-like deaminating enzyme